ncbi:hypothetical protein GIB67_039334 [Kingdonia uniflora]|uniref:Isopentenyl phosphate kinase n=1 Tax=Kingdonia uniflora TaxID=39325 RepID=A0A7J7LXC7_9MAGN|nr:hypothetical protein GIB67_039334 [Kingdonia uniflora]
MTDHETAIHHSNSSPLRCIVKLGGAAITCKNEIEKINEGNLETVTSHLRQAMMKSTSLSSSVIVPSPGMDWSKRVGVKEITIDDVDEFREGSSALLEYNNFVVVHGAGSFGHFQASRSGVHKGGIHIPLVKAGFVATRISVTSLNLEIVRALARGIDHVTGLFYYFALCYNDIGSQIYQVLDAPNPINRYIHMHEQE